MESPQFKIYKLFMGTSKNTDAPSGKTMPCVMKTKVDLQDGNLCIAVLGSVPHLGYWDCIHPVIAAYHDNGVWQAKVRLPVEVDIEYTWIKYEKKFCKIVEFEQRGNRKIRIDTHPLLIEDVYNGSQKVTHISHDDVARLERDPSINAPGGYKDGKSKMDDERLRIENDLAGTSVDTGYVGIASGDELLGTSVDNILELGATREEVGGRSVGDNDLIVNSDVSNWDTMKGMVARHSDNILKVGLGSGVAVAAFWLYKRFF